MLLVRGFAQQGPGGMGRIFKLTALVATTDLAIIFLLTPAFWVLAGLDLRDFF
jgi:hypothetical protein